MNRPYPKGHPHFFHVMMGGRPWMRRGGSRIERSYGDRYIKVRELAPHDAPKAYWLLPDPDDDNFVIPGRNIDAQVSSLQIDDPGISLVTIDGRRLNPHKPKLPTNEPIMEA